MRKKIIVLLTFILAFTVSLAVFAGCSGCGKVTITLSKETLEVTTGKTGTLSATASKDVEIVWESSDESIATVDNGKVSGIKAGKATITASAKKGKGSATCEVTVKDPVVFTIKDESGAEVSNVLVDRNGAPVQVTATASDGSRILNWSSDNEKVATVENGLITGRYDGEANITVATSTGMGTFKVTVYDTFKGTKYDITNKSSDTNWYYWVEHEDVTNILYNEARYNDEDPNNYVGGITFGFEGGNWNRDSVRLIYKAEKWEALLYFTATIVSDFDGVININGTRVALHEGENDIKIKYVYYQYFPYACYIEFGTAKDGKIDGGTITISKMNWYNAEQEQLKTPSFTLDGNDITITDENEEMGVEEYQIGLFRNIDDEKPFFIQILPEKTGVLDVTKLEENGDYYVKVMVVGNPGYTDSAWSEAAEDLYTVNNTSVSYDIPEGGGSSALTSSGWYYFVVDNGDTQPTEAKYEDGTLTFKTPYLGWAFYSTELLRHYPTFDKGTELLISMKINASHPGTVTISDTVCQLVKGDNDVYVKFTQKSTACTITVMFGKWAPNTNDYGVVDFPELAVDEENYTFIFTDISVTEYEATYLEPVSGEVADKKINVTDANKVGVKEYELGFFRNDKLVKSFILGENGEFSDISLNDGIYELRLRAIATDVRYVAAGWTVIGDYEVKNGGATYDIIFGGDEDGEKPTGNALTNPSTWYYWNDQNWTGSTVEINEAKIEKGIVTVDYKVTAGACDFGVQLYYKDPSISGDNQLTLKINSQKAIEVTVNGAKFQLIEGDNNLTVYYTQGGSYSFSMQVKVNAEEADANVLTISDIVYEKYTYKILTAPEVAVGTDGVISITDPNSDKDVSGYILGYFAEGSANPIAKIEVKNGDELDYSMVNSGKYTLKIMAVAADNRGYKDSAWNTGIEYEVDNPEGAKYTLETGFGTGDARNNPGRWGCWADQWWTGSKVTVSEAVYENKEVRISFASEGKCDWGLQINYVNPNYVADTTYTFDIVASADMDIQAENAQVHLKAGEKVTLTGGKDDSFYVHVNIVNGVGGTITISNVAWN